MAVKDSAVLKVNRDYGYKKFEASDFKEL